MAKTFTELMIDNGWWEKTLVTFYENGRLEMTGILAKSDEQKRSLANALWLVVVNMKDYKASFGAGEKALTDLLPEGHTLEELIDED